MFYLTFVPLCVTHTRTHTRTLGHSVTVALYPVSSSMSASLLHITAPENCYFRRAHTDPRASRQYFRAHSASICRPLALLKQCLTEQSHHIFAFKFGETLTNNKNVFFSDIFFQYLHQECGQQKKRQWLTFYSLIC